MENVASGLKETELKQSSVLQWKGLLDHFDSTRNALHTRFEELQEQFVSERKSIRTRNQEVEDREKELEANVLKFNSEMESKAKELHGIERLIEEKRNEVGVKEKRLLEIEISVRGKERDCDFIQKCIEERTEKLNKYHEDIELKRTQLNAINGSIEEGKKVFDLKQEQVKAAHKSLEECHKEIKLESEKLSLIQKSMVECSNTLESREKIIRDVELKVRGFGLVKKCREAWSCKVGVKERELEGWVEKLEFREKQIESKVEELNLIESRVNQCLNEVQLKEKSLEECSHGLKMKERQLEEQAKELKLKQKQFDSIRKSTEEDIPILNPKATEICQSLGITDMAAVSRTISVPEIEELDSSPIRNAATSTPNLQLCATADARNSQASPNEQLRGNNSTRNDMFFALTKSSDPSKLVLKLMQTSFAEYWRKGNVNFEATFMMNNMSILKDLTKVLPHVGPLVKEDAMRLAVKWQAKLRAETVNSLEILVFLQFIAAYGLISTFNGDEIVKLLRIISQHKQALELCQTHGIVDKIPDFVQNLVERRQLIEAVRFTCTFKLIDKFPPVPLLMEHVEDRRKFYGTRRREKKSLGEKIEVLDNQIADLRAVIQCIKDSSLESEFPPNAIEAEIVLLEKLKKNLRFLVPSVACEQVEQEQEKGNKRSASSFAFKIDQPPQQCESKRRRNAV